jgi:hypothetical protein
VLSRRSFLKGLAALPVVAMFLPKEVPATPKLEFKKFGTKSSRFMVIRSAVSGKDIIIEFVSYNQSVQSTAGSQKLRMEKIT